MSLSNKLKCTYTFDAFNFIPKFYFRVNYLSLEKVLESNMHKGRKKNTEDERSRKWTCGVVLSQFTTKNHPQFKDVLAMLGHGGKIEGCSSPW